MILSLKGFLGKSRSMQSGRPSSSSWEEWEEGRKEANASSDSQRGSQERDAFRLEVGGEGVHCAQERWARDAAAGRQGKDGLGLNTVPLPPPLVSAVDGAARRPSPE